ncbi:serine/threonine protein kinase [Saccharomycopsis crataegensis]|uniref:Serine/threonine protein kinase n=1 Tax=Saccharomycopsis crataegensis TaxID=43959 RepID=A0AAV5QWS0_9ASCO|nr:serine/threonine protein kinase [Saccharomycopsis crataegensis]
MELNKPDIKPTQSLGYLVFDMNQIKKIQLKIGSDLELQDNHKQLSFSFRDQIIVKNIKETFNNSGIYKISKNDIVKIGRNPMNNNLILENEILVSKSHCAIWPIQFEENSAPLIYLKDTSLNGVYVNDQLVGKNEIVLLEDGDTIEIKLVIKFVLRYRTYFKNLIESQSNVIDIQPVSSKWNISNRLVGCGTFGSVFIAKNIDKMSLTKTCAVKVIKASNMEVQIREAELLSSLNHPNIIKIFECHYENGKIYLFEELICGGDLFSYLARGEHLKALSEPDCAIIMYQILQAVGYLHSNGIVHRDLKLDNILLTSPESLSKIVLTDFGTAFKYDDRYKRMKTVVGTCEYTAPEVGLLNSSDNYGAPNSQTGYTSKCDMWSIGVILHIILSGISPFYMDGEERNIIKASRNCHLDFGKRQWKKVSLDAQDLIKHLLVLDQVQRFDCEDCLNHSWLDYYRELLDMIYRSKILRN